MTSEGRILSNSLDPTLFWVWAVSDRRTGRDGWQIFVGDMGDGPSFKSKSWSLTKSAS